MNEEFRLREANYGHPGIEVTACEVDGVILQPDLIGHVFNQRHWSGSCSGEETRLLVLFPQTVIRAIRMTAYPQNAVPPELCA